MSLTPPNHRSKGGKVRSKKRDQTLPDLITSHTGGSMTHDEAEPTLYDVMTILASVNTQLTAAEERAHPITPPAATALAEDCQPSSS